MLALLACLPFFMLLTLPFIGMVLQAPVSLPLPAKVLMGICVSFAPAVGLWVAGSLLASLGIVVLSLPILIHGYSSMIFLPFCATTTASPVSSFPVTILMSTFFLMYMCLSVVRTAADFGFVINEKVPLQRMLQTATLTVAFAPMLSALFLGYRQRVLWAGSEPGLFVQLFMLVPALAQIVKSATVLVIPLFTGEIIMCDPKTGEVPDDCKPFKDAKQAQAFAIGTKVATASTYVGSVLVLLGWGTYVFTPGPAPYTCVGIICFTYFAIYSGIFAIRQLLTFGVPGFPPKKNEDMLKKLADPLSKIENALMMATCSVNLAPMLCVQFLLGRRLGGTESSWFETLPALFATTAILIQAVLTIVVPVVLGGSVRCGRVEGDMEYEVENQVVGKALAISRYVLLLMLYVLGAGMHLAWVFTRVFSSCNADLPGTGSALLALMFWRIYLWLYLATTIREYTGFEWALLSQTFENTKGCAMYVPTIMTLLLFIDPQMGGPISFFVTYALPAALVTQSTWIFVCCLCTGCPSQCDEDGAVKWEPENALLVTLVMVGRMASFGLLNGGLLAGCLSMFLSNF